MAEGEQRRDVGVLVVPVSDVQPLAVDDAEVLAGPVVVGWGVRECLGESALRETVSKNILANIKEKRQYSPGASHWDF